MNALFIRLSDKYYSCILNKHRMCTFFFLLLVCPFDLAKRIKSKSYMYIYSTSIRQHNQGMTKNSNMLLNWIRNIEAGVDRKLMIIFFITINVHTCSIPICRLTRQNIFLATRSHLGKSYEFKFIICSIYILKYKAMHI